MRLNSRIPMLALIAAVVTIGASCASDPVEPPPTPAPIPAPAAMDVAYGDDQMGVAGSQLPQRIAVKVTDESGRRLQGVSVSFAVTSGGGSMGSHTNLTNGDGYASAAWILGSGPGSGAQSASATIDGTAIAPVTFTARAAAQLIRGAGDGQTGPIGVAVAEEPRVIILDADDQPVAGMPVEWTVTSGPGMVPSPTSLTDVNGVASTPWYLGLSVGPVHTLKASIAPQLEATFSATAVLTDGVIEVDGGNDQTGVVGTTLSLPLVVWAGPPYEDPLYAVPVQGVEVVWEVVGGGGSISAATGVTNASGRAQVRLTLGAIPGSNNQIVRASVAGFAGSPVTFTASATAGP